MKKYWTYLGRAAFWVCWPALFVYLRLGERTRVVVTAENKVLVVKPWLGSGKWVLPGGGLHKGEESKAGALRELYEETGLRLQPEDLEDGGQRTTTDSGLSYKYQAFFAKLNGASLLPHSSLEIIEIAWIPAQNINESNAEKSTINLVVSAQKVGS